MFSSRSTPLWFLIRLLVFLLILGAASEIWFRTVTPAARVPLSYFDSRYQIDRYDPNGPAKGLFTLGRLAERGGEWRVNKQGWISGVDYLPRTERSKPLVAILGDSYIEGFLSDVQEHVDPDLSAALGGRYAVYAFAKSGWYLEQYVATARYVSANFQPDVIVIFVNGGDVESSLRENGVRSDKWFQLGNDGAGFAELPPSFSTSRLGPLKRAVDYSATTRYLLFNAKVPLPFGLGQGVADVNLQVDQQDGQQADQPQTEESHRANLSPAAQYMIDALHKQNPHIPIVFVADGPRYLPAAEISAAHLDPDLAAISEASESFPDFYFLDLRPVFSADWELHHQLFESVDGHHWNAYGNQVVAQALARFLISNGLVD